MKPILNKRGQLNNLAPAMIALIIAAVFLVLGLIVFSEFQQTDIVAQAATTAVSNESVTMTGSAIALANAGLCQSECSVTEVLNATGPVINSGNYTVDSTACTIVNTTSEYIDSAWNVTYSVTHGDEACDSASETISGLGTFSDFWEIIVLAIVITLVIGLLLVVFGGRKIR